MALGFQLEDTPFDRLTPVEAQRVRGSLDIGYFRPLETIVARGTAPANLYAVIKGCVEERDGDELIGLRGPGDWFDARALLQESAANAFVAREETLVHMLPRALALQLIRDNPRFGAMFYSDLSRKLGAVAQDDEFARQRPMMLARVGELFLHPAVFVEAAASLAHVGERMRALDVNAAFVRDGARTGIVTGTDLWHATVLMRLPVDSAVRPVANFDVVSVGRDELVSFALATMTKHKKRRVAVSADGVYVGLLEDIDLLGFLAGGAQLLAARIDRAGEIADLAGIAKEIGQQPRMLRRQGVKIELVCEIVSDLNRALFAKLFALTASPQLREKSCLIVMGSEGRREQALRTDQDNGLILSEPVDEAELDRFRQAFSGTLASFGFPPCPGGVMVSNPFWSRTLVAFEQDFRAWLAMGDEDAPLNVAILADASAVAGDANLLDRLKDAMFAALGAERVFMARFARSIDAFPMPIGLFKHLVTSKAEGDALDLKKGGIFPIVHGVRTLALERGCREAGTAARIRRLCEVGALTPEFADELVEAFQFLMTLRLDAQLAEAQSDSLVKPGELSTMERDLLRDALHVAKKLREIVRHHFNLAMF